MPGTTHADPFLIAAVIIYWHLVPMMSILSAPPFRIAMVLLVWSVIAARLPAQVFPGIASTRFELDEAVRVPSVDGSVLAQLDRFDALLAEGHWSEAIDRLLSVAESPVTQLIPVTPQRSVNVDDYLHLRLSALPPAALAEYRARIDPIARRWYRQGLATRDEVLLRRVVDEAPVSTYGDDALMALGEIALERAEFADARQLWEQLVPAGKLRSHLAEDSATPNIDGPPRSGQSVQSHRPSWPGYPDTDLELADVRARLVLVSILEGDAARAASELAAFRSLHADAQGRLGGRNVPLADALAELLDESRQWRPQRAVSKDEASRAWPTFAGSPARNAHAAGPVDPRAVVWRHSLPGTPNARNDGDSASADYPHFPGSSRQPPCFPIVADGNVFILGDRQILAFNLADGAPAWGARDGVIFRWPSEGLIAERPMPGDTLGTPRYTLTAAHGRLLARLGSQVTAEPRQRDTGRRPGTLVCLDIRAEGRLLWQADPEEGWAFEGAPLYDGQGVYIGMRRGGVQTEAYVACLEPDDGTLRWRQFIAAADTPAGETLPQATHNLLTQVDRTLFYNTNLGAVAALSADDGTLHWISRYPRSRDGSLLEMAPHWRRALNPCVYHQGRLIVAPADSPRAFNFDAATGQMLWQSGTQLDDARHVVGVTNRHAILGGGRLYWIALDGPRRGQIEHLWPDGSDRPGYGRGVIAGDVVLFPTLGRIHVFNVATAEPRRAIAMHPRNVTGGNVMVVGDRLLVVNDEEIVALKRR